jgi:hypothetical protein
MATFFIVVGIVISICCVVVAIFSYGECKYKLNKWREEVALKMVKLFNLRPDIAARMVEQFHPTWPWLLKDFPHPDIAANAIFWNADTQLNLNQFHYIGRQVPTHLFTPDNFGRVYLEA